MLDLKFIREHADVVRKAVADKGENADIDRVLGLDEAKRHKQHDFDTLRADQNRVSKGIGLCKKNGQDASNLLASMKKIAGTVRQLGSQLAVLDTELQRLLLTIPNIPRKDVPVGGEADNALVSEWGTPREFDFTPQDHLALCEAHRLVDFARGAKLSGTGFPVYTGNGALLERALVQFMLDTHITRHGYTEIIPPLLVNTAAMTGTGQLPKMADDMYHIASDDLYLIPTSEVPLTNFHSGEILPLDDLPRKYVAFTPNFRREAGSYGKMTKGLLRLHQFNKVEMVRLTEPQDSSQALEEMIEEAAFITRQLGLAYRILRLATGDLSFASHVTYDIEVWSPGAGRWLEVSSLSDFRDFQARRMGIRYRNSEGKVAFVHTLNGSGLATSRIFPAIVETYQRDDGTIEVPEVLRPYMRGLTTL
ncbi:MAG: serine--tRNA ligase [Candidatus Cloacimonetes bacterium]|nr:serine--tRNA ligase [Candidatus Cloacimonadota bacterium]